MISTNHYTVAKVSAIALFLCLLTGQIANAQSQSSEGNEIEIPTIFTGVEMSGNWFISYRDFHETTPATGTAPQIKEHTNAFVLKRSYFTLKKRINETFSVRYTQDLTIDREGSDEGNVETRLKYLYVKAEPEFESNIITGFWGEVGMVHTPWLDYEQAINTYRVQDNMAIERARIISSADFGVVFGGNIGPEMDKEFLDNVNDAMTGKYMSFMLGIYNGGGYSAVERNLNKVFSGRISIRPLPELLPEIQLASLIKLGKGNTVEEPDFKQFLGFVAYTGKNITVTTQYHSGRGDFKGDIVDPTDPSRSLENSGYSFFSEVKIPNTNFAVWGRYDYFDVKEVDRDANRYIGGITYKINSNLRLVLNSESADINNITSNVYELNLEIKF